jgi:ssDNA-binding Zn-finger/Zn-ribbon topoisomerase 1|tara:strand:+ start:1982 stop:2953 length:972 start_codon:yes stop_codon:yes gene_type:complete
MDIIDSKFIGLVSSRLQKFKRVKADLYNFRCPLCGDSQKHKNKARGYLYQVKTNTNYKCHNCGASMSFNNFIKQIDPTLHKQYTMEKFKEGYTGKNFVVEEPKLEFKKPVFKKELDLPRASEVPIAKEYLEKRMLDPTKFYFAKKFRTWVNSKKRTFDSVQKDESRIIIPMYDTERNLIGFQGRALGPNFVKYITVMLKDDAPKVFGLEQIDKTKTVYVTEGPFDSTFIRNSIAMCGADGDVRGWGISRPVWVYDNEPRSSEILKRIESTIDRGECVVIWPQNIKEKDINDMVLSKYDIMSILELNTYSGLEAKVKFNNWKKV